MNKYITAAFGILILLVVGFAAGRWFMPVAESRAIAVSGECLARVEKDTTAVTLRMTALDRNAGTSLRMAQDTYARVANYLREIRDDSLEMQTMRFDTYEKNEWDHMTQRSESLGFETTISLTISSKNRATIEQILTDIYTMENIFPENLRIFTSNEKMKPALEACIQTAVENARDKATAVAAADGVKIGKMISVSFNRTAGDNDFQGPRPMMMRAMAMDSATGGGAPELFATDTDISVVVHAAFEMK